MNINSKLCSYCKDLISTTESEQGKKIYDHQPSTSDLFNSARTCPICATLCDYFFDFLDDEKLIPRYPDRHEETVSLKYGLLYPDDETDEIRWIFQFYCPLTRDARTNGNHIGNLAVKPVLDESSSPMVEASSSTGSEQSWNLATTWIQTCIRSHHKCNRKSIENWLPTRVLDLGLPGNVELRLHISDESSPKSPYMTLSHCWGQLQPKKLSTANLPSLCEKINMSELPKTFQEAINFTRHCGVRYLWIDSLCIIQDSQIDWATESARMGDVYKNALCNIAATGAADGRTGCFFERNPILVPPLRVQMDSFPGHTSPSGLYDLVPEDFWWHNIEDAPLNQRAWVVQEQFLSARVLHCAKNQLLWECHQLAACEMYPKGIPPNSIHGSYISDFKWSNLAEDVRKGSMDIARTDYEVVQMSGRKSGALGLWNQLLFTYTLRSLTEEKDKLIAISAVAREIQPLMKGDYLAGIWRTHMAIDLLWNVRDIPANGRVKPYEYTAPSWSWASVTAEVSFFNPETHVPTHPSFMIQILSTVTNPVTDDPFGQISSGFLCLRGHIKSLKGMTMDDDYGDLLRSIGNSKRYSDQVAFARMDEPIEYPVEELYCLPILNYHFALVDEAATTGLLLISTGKKGQFRRVGKFESRGESRVMFRRPIYPPDPEQHRGEEATASGIRTATQFAEVQRLYEKEEIHDNGNNGANPGENKGSGDISESTRQKWASKAKRALRWRRIKRDKEPKTDWRGYEDSSYEAEDVETDEWAERIIEII